MRFSVLKNKAAAKINICIEEKVIIWINFNPGLALAGFQTILPGFKQVNRTWASDPIKTIIWSAVNFGKTRDLDELSTWARDMATWYWSADTLFWQVSVDHNMDVRYQSTPEVHGKPRLHISVNLLLEYGRHVARLHRRRRRRRRAYAPTSNTAGHGTHEKINSWVPFSSLIWVWGSAWWPFGRRSSAITL